MAKLKWFGAKEDVDQLIASGKLKRAIPLLEAQLRENPGSVSYRQRLGDILGRAGHNKRAIAVLAPLIDKFAEDGFSTKAIAVIKKLERLDPERVDTTHLINKVRKKTEPKEKPLMAKAMDVVKKFERADSALKNTSSPLFSGHLQADTITLDPFHVDGAGDRPTATSTVDSDWLGQRDSKFSTFGWSPLLEDLPPEDFDAVVGNLNLLVKNPGAIIFGQGEHAASIFVLASGFARAYRRSQNHRYRQIRVFEEGQFFGEEALFENTARRPITVTAASECELLEIDLHTLKRVTTANPATQDHLEKVYKSRAWVF